MPLSFGILIGLAVLAFGAAMYMGTRHKRVAMVLIGVGAALAMMTIGIVVLAVNSGM